jgi:mannose-6-phosphate isomerase-like protein (cupin superfamily)
MSRFTLANLGDGENMTAGSPMADKIQFRRLREELESEHLGLGHFRLAPDFRVPFGHRHAQQEEVYVILAGSGRFKLDDEIVDVAQHDVLRVAPQTWRSFESGPDGMEILVTGSGRPPEGDGERQPDWWTD